MLKKLEQIIIARSIVEFSIINLSNEIVAVAKKSDTPPWMNQHLALFPSCLFNGINDKECLVKFSLVVGQGELAIRLCLSS